MDSSLVIIISLILLIIGLMGTVLPVLPGLIVSFLGILLYKFGTSNDMPMLYVWLFGALTITSGILNYWVPARTNKKYGGTRWGSVGSFIGTLIGFIWIPIPFGFLIGMLLGVFLGELLHDIKDKQKALNSVKGAFVGFFISTGFSFMIGLAMFLVTVYYAFF